jgi:hypothetical protein
MNPHRSLDLPDAPASVEDDHGQPRFGTYAGSVPEVNLARLRGAYHLGMPGRLAKHKRWQYVMIATPDVLAVLSVADLGYTANAFACAVDLRESKVLFDAGYLGLPSPFTTISNHPAAGASAKFHRPAARFSIVRPRNEDPYQIKARASRWRSGLFSCSAAIAAGQAPPLTMIGPVPADGVVNVTQKWTALPASGTIKAGGRQFGLEGGMAGLDYTNGYLARRTSWRWGFATGRLSDGTAVGLNLVEGFNEASEEANENALWIGGRLIPLDRARFEYNRSQVLDPWRVTTKDGVVELRFCPVHAHREERDYKIVKSHFVQPLGLFEGQIKLDGKVLSIEKLPGVVEDQDVVW